MDLHTQGCRASSTPAVAVVQNPTFRRRLRSSSTSVVSSSFLDLNSAAAASPFAAAEQTSSPLPRCRRGHHPATLTFQGAAQESQSPYFRPPTSSSGRNTNSSFASGLEAVFLEHHHDAQHHNYAGSSGGGGETFLHVVVAAATVLIAFASGAHFGASFSERFGPRVIPAAATAPGVAATAVTTERAQQSPQRGGEGGYRAFAGTSFQIPEKSSSTSNQIAALEQRNVTGELETAPSSSSSALGTLGRALQSASLSSSSGAAPAAATSLPCGEDVGVLSPHPVSHKSFMSARSRDDTESFDFGLPPHEEELFEEAQKGETDKKAVVAQARSSRVPRAQKEADEKAAAEAAAAAAAAEAQEEADVEAAAEAAVEAWPAFAAMVAQTQQFADESSTDEEAAPQAAETQAQREADEDHL